MAKLSFCKCPWDRQHCKIHPPFSFWLFTGSPTKEGPGSPTRSPTKSPRKRGSKARDVLTLPKPYSHLKSDQIKRWNKEMLEGKVVGADNEAELELFKSVNFTNALVLKINQLAKQVTLIKIQSWEIWIRMKILAHLP